MRPLMNIFVDVLIQRKTAIIVVVMLFAFPLFLFSPGGDF